jgi:hypothetical protein
LEETIEVIRGWLLFETKILKIKGKIKKSNSLDLLKIILILMEIIIKNLPN